MLKEISFNAAEIIPYKNDKEKFIKVHQELRKGRYVKVWDNVIYSAKKWGKKMDKYWVNQSGCYDPTAATVIENESNRSKEIHNTIKEIKEMLKDKDLILIERIKLKDTLNNKTYR